MISGRRAGARPVEAGRAGGGCGCAGGRGGEGADLRQRAAARCSAAVGGRARAGLRSVVHAKKLNEEYELTEKAKTKAVELVKQATEKLKQSLKQ